MIDVVSALLCFPCLSLAFQSLLEACVTDTGAMDFGRSGATGLAKQVRDVLRRVVHGTRTFLTLFEPQQ